MAVPKRKHSHSRSCSRAANKGIEAKTFTFCTQSGFPVAPHTVCLKSGYYKGEKVLTTKFERAMKRNAAKQQAAAAQGAASAQTEVAPEVLEAQAEVAQEQKAKKSKKAE